MKHLPLLRCTERFPGGLMVVPLLTGAAIATFVPGTAKFFGSFTEARFNGALTILAVFYVCMGTTIELTATAWPPLRPLWFTFTGKHSATRGPDRRTDATSHALTRAYEASDCHCG